MADQGKRIDESTQRTAAKMRSQGVPYTTISEALRIARSTAQKYGRPQPPHNKFHKK